MGLDGFCFAAIDSRSGTPNILLGLNGMILGPSLATWVLMGVRVRMHEQAPCCHCMVVSIGSDAQLWVSE